MRYVDGSGAYIDEPEPGTGRTALVVRIRPGAEPLSEEKPDWLDSDWEEVVEWSPFGEAELAAIAADERRAGEAESVAAYARMMAPSLPDERAVECRWLFPDWSGEGAAYAEGDRRMHGGALWKCVSAHTSQPSWEPGAAPSLWAEVLPGQSGGAGPWERPGATNPYMKGDRVTHAGRTWESLVDGNVWEPGAQGSEGLWRDVTGARRSGGPAGRG